ncbi:MAG: hypothetical protein LBB18_04170, partial [Puniceicoccales bacterium]|nr:hypothetical protein [Puniceicoccales bacterium]
MSESRIGERGNNGASDVVNSEEAAAFTEIKCIANGKFAGEIPQKKTASEDLEIWEPAREDGEVDGKLVCSAFAGATVGAHTIHGKISLPKKVFGNSKTKKSLRGKTPGEKFHIKGKASNSAPVADLPIDVSHDETRRIPLISDRKLENIAGTKGVTAPNSAFPLVQPGNGLHIFDPTSEYHKKWMEDQICSEFGVKCLQPPSTFCTRSEYSSNLNAELKHAGSRFLLGDGFFKGEARKEWRKENIPLKLSKKEMEKVRYSKCPASEEEKNLKCQTIALDREISEIWPDTSSNSATFSRFVTESYGFSDGTRFSAISSEERQLLINAVLKTKELKGELQTLNRCKTLSKEKNARKNLLKEKLDMIEGIVSRHDFQCSVRLQEIIRTWAEQLDAVVNDGKQINTVDDASNMILAMFRQMIASVIADPKEGSFTNEKHFLRTILGVVEVVIDFARPIIGFDEEMRVGVKRFIDEMLNSVNINSAVHPYESSVGEIPAKDFILPCVDLLISQFKGEQTRSGKSITGIAESVFRNMSTDTRSKIWNTFMDLNVTFSDYCFLTMKDPEAMRKTFVERINDLRSGNTICDDIENLSKLENWCNGQNNGDTTNSMTFDDIGCMLMNINDEKLYAAIPELSCADADKPKCMANLFFMAYLCSIGALVPNRGNEKQSYEEPMEILPFGKNAIETRMPTYTLFKVVPHGVFLHPKDPGSLFFEAQKKGSKTCGIHAFNNFMGFSALNEVSILPANLLRHCLQQKEEMLEKIKKTRKDIENMSNFFLEHKIVDYDEKQKIDGIIAKCMDSLNVMEQAVNLFDIDLSVSNNPLHDYGKLINDINENYLVPYRELEILTFDSFTVNFYDKNANVHKPKEFSKIFKEARNSSKALFQSLTNFEEEGGIDIAELKWILAKQGLNFLVQSGKKKELVDGTSHDDSEGKNDFLR